MQQNNFWIQENGTLYNTTYRPIILETPGPGVFEVVQPGLPMDTRIGLKKIMDEFVFDYKIYDLDTADIMDRIISTWVSKYYKKTEKNLGVIFNGTKGTGKTIAAKILANALGLPIIIVPANIPGLEHFLQQIDFECTVIIDEAEKVFPHREGSEVLLRIMDGLQNKSRKLYILTTNNLYVSENLLGRPGRIRYIKEFRNLSQTALLEYLEDNLIDKSKREEVLVTINSLQISTIDILKSVIDEINIHGSLDGNYLNIPRYSYRWQCHRFEYIDSEEEEMEIRKLFREHRDDWDEFLKTKHDDDKSWYNYLDDEYDYTGDGILTSDLCRLVEGVETSDGSVDKPIDKDGWILLRNRNSVSDQATLVKIIREVKTLPMYSRIL